MTKNKKENFLKNRLLFWVGAIIVALIFIYVVEIAYTACATTYSSTATLSDYHRNNISFMQTNRVSSMNLILFRYDIIDGKYVIDFALIYNLLCTIGILACAFAVWNVYTSLGMFVRHRNNIYINKRIKYTAAMHNLRTEMRYARGRKNKLP